MVSLDNPLKDVGGALAGKVFSGILWFGIAFIIIAVLGGVMWYFLWYRRKFDILVKIKSERAIDQKEYFDKAAILYDRKDKINYFRLRDTMVDLPTPPFNVLRLTNYGDYLEIWRKSEDEFIYLVPPKINKTTVVKHDGQEFTISESEQKQVEGDIGFWNVKRKERNRGLFGADSLLMKILPYLPQIIGGIFMIFMLYILMDSLPTLITTLTELAKQMNNMRAAEVVTHGA